MPTELTQRKRGAATKIQRQVEAIADGEITAATADRFTDA